MINRQSDNIAIEGHDGTWYVVEERITDSHGHLFLLEHEEHGDEAACLIVDPDGNVILDDVWNGYDDFEEALDAGELSGRRYRVYGHTTVTVVTEVYARTEEAAYRAANEKLCCLDSYVGNGGTDKLVGVDGDLDSVSADAEIEYDDVELICDDGPRQGQKGA